MKSLSLTNQKGWGQKQKLKQNIKFGKVTKQPSSMRILQNFTQKAQQKDPLHYLESTWDKISVDDLDAWQDNGPLTPLLDSVNYPVHLKNFNVDQLKQLCKELRQDCVHQVSRTGGHLGASLGVVELTVALHHVFEAPADRIIWDVGHQAYIHKMLTGRRQYMSTIRQTGGLSGFTNRAESEYDPFGTGHSSTSISAGLGMAAGRDHLNRKNHVVSVIGDGAITGGMAYEAMNHAGFTEKNMLIILNDNQQVSLPTQYNGKNQPPVGGLSTALARIYSSNTFREGREIAKKMTKYLPESIQELTSKVDDIGRNVTQGGTRSTTLFEELGLYYLGPIDGHNLEDLVFILKEIKASRIEGPVLLHCITRKGNGYLPAAGAEDKMHGVVKYDFKTGKQKKGAAPKVMSYTNYFADALAAEAEADHRVVAVHAAMAGGTGLTRFEKRFPDRVWDVGIAEQHAVCYAAGMATEGLRPTCAIYSSFLQRGYDQVVHDVCLQKLPVRFAMDRGGMVGADGGTHQGTFDVAYMACLPNMMVMAPSNEAELINMIATSIQVDDMACCYRYPRGSGVGIDLAAEGINENLKGKPLPIGKGVVRMGGSDVCLLGYGTMVNHCLQAANILKEQGISATVVDARFCKPLDQQLIRQIAKEHPAIVSVEEGSVGGFGDHVLHFMALDGLLDGNVKFRPMTLPDRFIEHGAQTDQWQLTGLTPNHIARTAAKVIGKKIEQFAL